MIWDNSDIWYMIYDSWFLIFFTCHTMSLLAIHKDFLVYLSCRSMKDIFPIFLSWIFWPGFSRVLPRSCHPMHRILDSLRSLSDFSWASWMNKIPKIVLATLFLPTISDEFVCWSTMNTVYLYKQKICVIVDKHVCSNSFIFSGNIERWLCSKSYNYQFFSFETYPGHPIQIPTREGV